MWAAEQRAHEVLSCERASQRRTHEFSQLEMERSLSLLALMLQ